jgi:Spy/CpxP family protein refolding chaperone
MNQPLRSKLLLSLFGLASACLLTVSCTTSTTTAPSSPATSDAASSPASSGSSAPAAAGGGDANPLTVGLEKSDRSDADPLQLIQSKQLKDELKITDEQSAKLKEAENELRSIISKKNASLNLKGLDAKAKEEKLKAVSKELDSETKASRDKIGTILQPDQLKRMKEIFLQIYGWGVLTRQDFQESLKLTADQNKQLDTLSEKLGQEMRTGWEIPGDDPAKQAEVLSKNRKRIEGTIKASNAKALEVLTAEQKKTLETLKGKAFNFNPGKADK